MRATPALRRSVLKVLDQDVQRTFPLQQEEAGKATQCCLSRILLGDSYRAIYIGGPTTCTPHFADELLWVNLCKTIEAAERFSIELRPAKPVLKPQSRRNRINRPG